MLVIWTTAARGHALRQLREGALGASRQVIRGAYPIELARSHWMGWMEGRKGFNEWMNVEWGVGGGTTAANNRCVACIWLMQVDVVKRSTASEAGWRTCTSARSEPHLHLHQQPPACGS